MHDQVFAERETWFGLGCHWMRHSWMPHSCGIHGRVAIYVLLRLSMHFVKKIKAANKCPICWRASVSYINVPLGNDHIYLCISYSTLILSVFSEMERRSALRFCLQHGELRPASSAELFVVLAVKPRPSRSNGCSTLHWLELIILFAVPIILFFHSHKILLLF